MLNKGDEASEELLLLENSTLESDVELVLAQTLFLGALKLVRIL